MKPKTANEVLDLMNELEITHDKHLWWKSLRRFFEQQQAAEEKSEHDIEATGTTVTNKASTVTNESISCNIANCYICKH